MPQRSDEGQLAQWGDVEQSEERRVELSLPTRTELWGLARMAVASIASLLAYDFEVIEDLRLAVDELCIACAHGASSQSILHLTFSWSDAGLYLECEVSSVTSELVTLGAAAQLEGLSQLDLSESILSVLVDAYGISPVENGSRVGWLRKSVRTGT